MDITPEELKSMIAGAVDEAVKANLPTNGDGGLAAKSVEVVKDEADQPWGSDGEFFKAVKTAALYPQNEDPRLRALKAPTGLGELVPADGGYLVAPAIASGILEKMHTGGELLSRAASIELGANSNGMVFHGVNETSRATGSRWGGVRGYWMAEAGTKTASHPTFYEIELKLKKVAALVYATDELLADTSALASWLGRVVPDELRFLVEDAIFNGDGVGKPLGIMNAPCRVAVQRGTASTIVLDDVLQMWQRRFPGYNDYVWFIGPDSHLQLFEMTVGTVTYPVYLPPTGAEGAMYGRLLGRPVIETEFNPALNTAGDILLASMSQYQMITKGGVQSASSIHVNFVQDETAFRFVYRCDGQPTWNSALTPFSGAGTQSPFVSLGSGSA